MVCFFKFGKMLCADHDHAVKKKTLGCLVALRYLCELYRGQYSFLTRLDFNDMLLPRLSSL